MSEFENIVIGKSSVYSLAVTVILMFAIPAAFFVYWRRKHKEKTTMEYLVAGALGFIVSARVLELGVHYICILADNPVSRFINGSTAAYVLYGIVMAGVFEECGRYIVLKYILRENRTRENAVFYGIGHGGIEILAVVLPTMMFYLTIAMAFSEGNVEAALNQLKITEDTAAAALPVVRTVAGFGFASMFMNVIERLIAIIAHIALSVIVFYGISRAKKSCLPLAILLHMLLDIFAALYQRGVVPLWTVEVWAACWTALIAVVAFKFYKKL